MKRLKAALAVVALASIAPLAQASIQITWKIDGGVNGSGSCIEATNFGPGDRFVDCGSFNSLDGNLHIRALTAASNSPGTAAQSNEASDTVRLFSSDLSASHTIHIDVASQDFALPTAPPDLTFLSHIGGTVVTGASGNAISYRSCVDQVNSLAGCPGTYQSAFSKPAVTAAGTFEDNQSSFISPLLTGYAIDEQLDITIGAGGALGFQASTSLTPVPEPMSIALLGGVVLLTSRLIRRKRNQVS